MIRSCILTLIVALISACSVSPSISRTKTTLGEVDMAGLDCRRDQPAGSHIGRTICASPEAWSKYESEEGSKSQAMLGEIQDNTDNRKLYPGMRAD
jgi:hypothetical protein